MVLGLTQLACVERRSSRDDRDRKDDRSRDDRKSDRSRKDDERKRSRDRSPDRKDRKERDRDRSRDRDRCDVCFRQPAATSALAHAVLRDGHLLPPTHHDVTCVHQLVIIYHDAEH